MKKLSIIIVMLIALLLCSCSKSEDVALSGTTRMLEILLTDTEVLQLQIPTELNIIKQDNQHYWELSNGVGIYKMASKTTTLKKDEATGLYIGSSTVERHFDDCCVLIDCPVSIKGAFIQYLSVADVVTKDTNTYVELELNSLPEYSVKEDMEMTGNMYMPPNCEEVLYDIYNSKLYTEGSDWLMSVIIDSNFEDLKPELITMALLNSGEDKISGWYKSDDIFYCYSSSAVVGAKKLAYNSWYVYCSAPKLKDYVLTGINKVHAG